MVLFILFMALTTVCVILSAIALSRVDHLARPSDAEVIERLQRGVRVMSPGQARAIIGTMERKAARR